MTSDELKPCPFCGQIPKASVEYENYVISCQNKECLISALVCVDVEDKAEAIAAWNKRVEKANE